MIQLLATKYKRHIAYLLFLLMWLGYLPAHGRSTNPGYNYGHTPVYSVSTGKPSPASSPVYKFDGELPTRENRGIPQSSGNKDSVLIDGPSQPEMSSFQAAGVNNMVNLFTGDFNYNIPLLDVGGYPVNIFYSGGITPEQEASWVGLGWNINPGNVNRNMRGVPDDFNGEEKLLQYQAMKPNKTWGVRAGTDLEIFGSKFINVNLGLDLGASVNNYLGPAVEFGIKGNINASISLRTAAEKNADSILMPRLGVGLGIGGNFNSRYGLTASANASLTARFSKLNRGISAGAGLSTSYNSRTGVRGLQLYEQVAYNQDLVRKTGKPLPYSAGRSFALTSNISFARPSYVPVMRAVNTNSAFSGHLQIGSAFWGVFNSIETEVYFQKSAIEGIDTLRKNPMYGYMHYNAGFNDRNAVMDMSRFNDREVVQSTPVVSVPQYAYDVFTIQGEGTGGSVRAYRNDLGYVKDNLTTSRDKSQSIGIDVGIPSHYGANYNRIQTPSSIGEWNYGNKLRATIPFKNNEGLEEAVYLRSPGESSVINPGQYDKIGGTDLVRFKLDGPNMNPTLEPVLQKFDRNGRITENISVVNSFNGQRKKRTQVVSFLTAAEAGLGGLDKLIKSYNPDTLLDNDKFLKAETFNRTDDYRRGHHISQVNVTEGDGKRYVYGIPVYNIRQKDFSFTVNTSLSQVDDELASYETKDSRTNSDYVKENSPKDGYVQVTETPAYAHSFLLSGLLSPDYVDVTNDGITEDDLGTAIKFNYSRVKQNGEWANHHWRSPHSQQGKATMNAGARSEIKDDKGIVAYGERESWYLHSVESKSMIAVFRTGNRNFDGKGAVSEFGGVNANDNSLKRLNRIDLYNKADLKKNGEAGAKPIKSVHFQYSYRLCPGTPDNPQGASYGVDSSGKLTLEKIWFTYNGQNRVNKDQYIFSYGTTADDNPAYAEGSSDRWGNYKPSGSNPGSLKNRDYPYAKQNKELNSKYAAAWSLKKILLPSGGKIEVDYEGDDYAFVQNRRAAQMMSIAGFGKDFTTYSASLYDIINVSGTVVVSEKDYVFINVPESCSSPADVMNKYLQGQTQLAFKLAVKMPKGVYEYIPCYAYFEEYGVLAGNDKIVWLKIKKLDGLAALSLSAVEYLREQLPGQAFKGYDLSDGDLWSAAKIMLDMLGSIGKQLKNPVEYLRREGKAKDVDLTKSFVRMNTPGGYKFGGGHRVKAVRLMDNWAAMGGKFTSTYGQEYNYETTEVFNGQSRIISSGVASYEPSIGGDENPFQTIVQVANQLPMGPTSYGAIEMPVMDAFFPSPLVGYSKVTVTSIRRNIPEGKKSKSGIGRQVTEFYTAKDYPVAYSYTSFDPSSDKGYHKSSRHAFLNKSEFDSRAVSQGFLIVTNDMHGQTKSQSSYSETDPLTRINYTRNFYRNTGEKGLDEKFDFVHASLGGEVIPGNMGIDIELMTDTREFSVKSTGSEDQAQADLLQIGLATFPVFTGYTVNSKTENTYRAVTTTKTVSYHAVLDSVLVIDKGSAVSTKNLVYDAETGNVVVNRTNNEFDKPQYSVNYPAYWAYTGMGRAARNIDAVFTGVNFLDGRITSGIPDAVFESGDELLIINAGSVPAGCSEKLASSDSVKLIWAFDRKRNIHSLATSLRDIIFLDKKGHVYTRSSVSFRIIRSGHRNMLAANLASVTMMENPLVKNGEITKLNIGNTSKVISASAIDYREKWQNDADVFPKLKLMQDPLTCNIWEVEDCNGYFEKSINPYTKGLLGNFRAFRSFVFFNDREQERNTTLQPGLTKSGFIKDFELFWKFNQYNHLLPSQVTNTSKWIESNRATRFNAKGMELETKDAMGIYTAAQYGYSKTTPVTIANNARYNEIANDNFEDDGYNDRLNGKNFSICPKEHSNFRGMANSRITDAVASGFNAHTGRYVLEIEKNRTASREFNVIPAPIDSFNVDGYRVDTTVNLVELGGNLDYESQYPYYTFQSETVPGFNEDGKAGMSIGLYPNDTTIYLGTGSDYYKEHRFTKHMSQYIEIINGGNYSFQLMSTSDGSPVEERSFLQILIQGIDNPTQIVHSVGYSNSPISSRTVLLCKGIYKIIYVIGNESQRTVTGFPEQPSYYDYFVISTTFPAGYKSLDKENGCTYTVPFQASDSLFNPVFAPQTGTKMLFSAWVRQECQIPCTLTNYTDNKVQISFDAGSPSLTELKPSGPIIEGWQRYEGVFTVPATATKMTTSFVNSSADKKLYFDDIRIHPFNSNMKSYVYDPVNLRLVAEMDANNYASFYEYDAEGILIRTKAETREGIKTITENRSSKQSVITNF